VVFATMTSKGQLTIPKELRDQLGLKAGDRVEFVPDADGKVTMRRAKYQSITDLFGILPAGSIPATVEEMDEVIGEAIADHVLRGTRE
jgi:antitoxin PrlF